MKRFVLLIAVAALALPAAANAGTVEVDFIGVTLGQNITVHRPTLPNPTNLATTAGQYQIKTQNPVGLSPASAWQNTLHQVYCIDVVEFAHDGFLTFTLTALENAPVSTGYGTMGAAKALLIKKLWKGVTSGLGLDPQATAGVTAFTTTQAAAFGMAIWEIVWEDLLNPLNVDGDDNVNRGDFYATTNDPVQTLANTWLTNISTGGSWAGLSVTDINLAALSRAGAQDFMLVNLSPGQEVPTPGAFVHLMGIGLIGLVGYRRFRRKSA